VSTPADPPGGGTPDPEVVRGMRRDMGRDLARRREEAGLTQEKFADLTGRYGRGTVSHAETGIGDTGREFWVIADRLLGTGGLFAEFHDLIREYLGQEKRAAVTGDGVKELRCHVVLKSAQPLTALGGYRRLGWPVTADGDRLALVTGTVADVLEVTRPAGAVATAWWLETGGAGTPAWCQKEQRSDGTPRAAASRHRRQRPDWPQHGGRTCRSQRCSPPRLWQSWTCSARPPR